MLVCCTRFDRWSRRAVFMAACIIVPILANGVRAWATIYVAQYVGAEAAGGFDHIVYGWIFFALVVAALLGGAWRFFEREPEEHGWTADFSGAMALGLPRSEVRTLLRRLGLRWRSPLWLRLPRWQPCSRPAQPCAQLPESFMPKRPSRSIRYGSNGCAMRWCIAGRDGAGGVDRSRG